MPDTSVYMPPAAAFAEVLTRFADAIADNFRRPVDASPEDQLKGPVGELLRGLGELLNLDVGWRTEVRPDDVDGRPDIGVLTDGLLSGLVELKRPGLGARAERFTGANRRQWNRFESLPNLIYTDGSEWSLYRTGELKHRVSVADDVSSGGANSIDPSSISDLRDLLIDFLHWDPIVPSTAEGLATFLAPLARVLRDEVETALNHSDSALQSLADEWGGLLFPEGDLDQFADAYAQTVTYALLLAKFEGADQLRPLIAADALKLEHALLSDALLLLESDPVRDELRMPIELLERAIGAVDSVQIDMDNDPWLYFYEHFLAAYDPKLRKDRGVYFTPIEVVRTQVRLAGELLRTRFNKTLGFAADDVVVLDPAVGTGTYPLAVLDHAADAVRTRLGEGAVEGKMRGLAERLHAFEILVGAYSVAHLRISQRLRDFNVTDKPSNVYLTDTLESPNGLADFPASMMQASLTEEHNRALKVKKDTRIFVCLGNPPYNREERDPSDESSHGKGGWVRYGDEGSDETPILEDFLKPARDAGQGVHIKNLYNDYIYFWRWALWKVFDSTADSGIVSFITASSYLRGPGFAGMRRKMREVFDELWIIDLEGDNIGARKTENVFSIRTPVAIAIGLRDGEPKPETPAKVWKVKLTGSTADKLAKLDHRDSLDKFDWHLCSSDWDAPFYPAGVGTYFDWPALTNVFPWQHSGAQLKRKWPIGETRDVLANRWRTLTRTPSLERSRAFRATSDRKIEGRYRSLDDSDALMSAIENLDPDSPTPKVVPYAYRSFERQWIIRDSRIGDRMRPELWSSYGGEQVYITSLLTDVLGSGPAATASAEIPDLHHFSGRGAKDVIPLWRDADATDPNVTKGLLDRLGDAFGCPTTANRLFAYAYGILAQTAYVDRFWDELELPPPRLPIAKNADLFDRVADHGAELLYLHTYGKRFGDAATDGSVPQGVAGCDKGVSEYPESYEYDRTNDVLRVGDGVFAPIKPEVWDYSVSGMQIVKSWLDRRSLRGSGRKSSPLDNIRPESWDFIEDLLELLWVLERTIELQPVGAGLLEKVCESELFSAAELPTPSATERRAPRKPVSNVGQGELGA